MVIDFVVILGLYLVFFRKWKTLGKDVLLVNTLMYVYLAFVLYFTLMPVVTALPFVFDHAYVPMNLVPFIDVSMGRGDYWRQIILNIVMTVPFGILFPLTRAGKGKFWRTVLMCFLMSLGIELLQPLIDSTRSSDITDLITNVTGGVVGYGFYLALRPVWRKALRYLEPEKEGQAEEGVL